jgi:hypothetical protein
MFPVCVLETKSQGSTRATRFGVEGEAHEAIAAVREVSQLGWRSFGALTGGSNRRAARDCLR